MTSSLIASAMLRDPLYHIECLTAPSYTKYLISSMHVAALVARLRQRLAQCRSEPGVIVGDDELDTVQAARLEPGKEVPPTRPALAIGKLDGQDVAPAV